MCSNIWLEITSSAEAIGFGLSLILHSILIVLVSEKPKTAFGNYKYLMLAFSVLGIFYSSCNFWSKPNVHITKTSFIVFTVLKLSNFSKSFGSIAVSECLSFPQPLRLADASRALLPAVYCSCYAMMLSLLSIHFFYRFTSVTAPFRLLTRFNRAKTPLWMLFVVIYSLIWGLSSYFLCGPTESKDLELVTEFREVYCMEPAEYAYVGPQYFYQSPDSSRVSVHFPSFIGISILALQMGATFICVTYFGVRTYSTLYELGITGYSSKELQKQLFRTLVVQTCIPLVFMYIPVSCMFLFPIFGLKIEAIANFIPISVAVYPCLEPLVAIYIIKDFRNRIKDIATCFKKQRSQVGCAVPSVTDNSRVRTLQNDSQL